MAQWLKGKIVARTDWTSHLFSLKIQCNEFPAYTAGQFVKLAVTVDGRRIFRAYSLVSAPRDSHLEVLVVLVEGGRLSTYLHSLAVDDILEISGEAKGKFTLEVIPDEHNLWMMATGTGVGPFISMLEQGELWRRKGKAFLLYGVRYQNDLAYYQRIRHWLLSYPQKFCFVPVVSREIPDYGVYGRLTALLDNQRVQNVCGHQISADTDSVMLCGNPEMIQDTTALLEHSGHKRYRPREGGNIHTERYW